MTLIRGLTMRNGKLVEARGKRGANRGGTVLRERDIIAQCLGWLRTKGWRAIRLQSALANDGGRRYRIGEPGIPDYIIVRALNADVRGDECFFLETKPPGGKLRPAQLLWHEQARHEGLTVCVADGLEALTEWYKNNME